MGVDTCENKWQTVRGSRLFPKHLPQTLVFIYYWHNYAEILVYVDLREIVFCIFFVFLTSFLIMNRKRIKRGVLLKDKNKHFFTKSKFSFISLFGHYGNYELCSDCGFLHNF